jgi:hypothetical protein
MAQDNNIYSFLKQNNLTTKTEEEFNKEYLESPEKQAQLYSFFSQNNLTSKSQNDFIAEYFSSSVEGEPVNFTNGSQEPQEQPTNTSSQQGPSEPSDQSG